MQGVPLRASVSNRLATRSFTSDMIVILAIMMYEPLRGMSAKPCE